MGRHRLRTTVKKQELLRAIKDKAVESHDQICLEEICHTSSYISSSNMQISLSITVTNNHRITRKQLKEIKMK